MEIHDPTVEHGLLMSGGGYQIRNGHPDIDAIFPLAEWIAAEKRHGGHVYRRTIIIIDDWEEC